ncbi:MAG: RimK/LysX family protein [Halioglobus sp.]
MMNLFKKLPFTACLTSIFLLSLAGCNVFVPAEDVQDPRLAQVVAGMDKCLANQTMTNEQLQSQKQLLDQQQQQLAALTQGQAAALEASVDRAAPTPVAPAVAAACYEPDDLASKLVVGELEQVWLQNLNFALPARIDTGAETASLDARNIELFERNGRRWVRFEIVHPGTGESLLLERKLKRMVVIFQSNTAEAERRPVIKLGITIGNISQMAEFSLSNRAHLDYQLLIGRNILQDVMVVDVSKKNIAPYVLPDGDSDGSVAAP